MDHYMVYGLQPEAVSPLSVHLQDQFGEGFVDLTNIGKVGSPVSMAISPNLPSGLVLEPFENLSWYEFFEAQAPQFVRVKNQFSSEYKGAIWEVFDGHFLLVPATMDFQGAIALGQHWKCYDAVTLFDPDLIVNLQDQFHLVENVVVGPGRYLCNPAEKNFEGPPVFPEAHLACYEIIDAPLNELHTLEDQFGVYPDLLVENPELLCLPSLKFIPEPGALLSFGSGLMLLGWLHRWRRRRSIG